MVVGRNYLLKKPAGPGASKHFFDTQVVPYAVNMAGHAEVALDRAAARTGARPRLLLAGAAALLSMALIALARPRGGR